MWCQKPVKYKRKKQNWSLKNTSVLKILIAQREVYASTHMNLLGPLNAEK